MRNTLRNSGVKLHWYGNTSASWLHYTEEELASDGITTVGFLLEEDLIERLRWHPYALIPSGSLDEHDDRPELARLSLPSRIPYLAAVANLPLIVLGNRDTAAGHFVNRFGLGLVCPYESRALHEAAIQISTPEVQLPCRKSAVQHGSAFSLDQPGEWIWHSLAQGAPVDDRFEKLLPRGH